MANKFFPVSIDLNNKNVLVIGAGKIALRKIETLLNYNCNINVITKEILEENGLHNIEIIKSLNELEESQKIQINQELLDNMKQKRLYQEEEINKIFKKS